MAPTPFSDSVAARVRRFPRAASRQARSLLSALFTPSPVERTTVSRAERQTPVNSRYFLRSSRRQA